MSFQFPEPRQYGPAAGRRAYAWRDPPTNEVGMPVGCRMRFGRGVGQLSVGWFVAYSTGIEFQTVASLVVPDAPDNRPEQQELRLRLLAGLSLEVVLPGGQKVPRRLIAATEPESPVLTRHPGSGSGSASQWRETHDWFLWPLPPQGRLAFVCTWREVGIDGEVVEVDGERFRAASRHSLAFWSE